MQSNKILDSLVVPAFVFIAIIAFSNSNLVSQTGDKRNASVFASEPEMILTKGAGEGPAWHPSIGLIFSGGGGINRLSEASSVSFLSGTATNGLFFDRQGRLIRCESQNGRVTRRDQSGNITVISAGYGGKRFNQPNDLTVDAQGRIYFSDPKYGPRTNMYQFDKNGKPVEGVYRIDSDGKTHRIITHEVDRPNGLLVSHDQNHLFVADNNNNTDGGARFLWRFDLRANGNVDVDSQKLIYDWGTGRGPDGMVQDRAGNLYVAGGLNRPQPPHETVDEDNLAGIYVFSPAGKLIDFARIPRDECTNCTFGDSDLKTLYVTAGGTLWKIRTKTPGWLIWANQKEK